MTSPFPVCTFSAIMLLPILMILINRHRLLMTLLYLEMLLLMIIMTFYLMVVINSPNLIYLIFIMLVVGACGATIGLSCMVKMMRSYGNDNVMTMALTKC